MKIELLENSVALLITEEYEIIGVFNNTGDARAMLEQAVSDHWVCPCTLCDDRDFTAPLDDVVLYQFRLYADGCDDEYVTLRMIYAPVYH
jgi:hypothetical protein